MNPFDRLHVELQLRWPEWGALSFFAALMGWAIPFHEPWADEAQAWQLARTLSLRSLFQDHIRYEAAPGLWYLLLWAFNQVHLSYSGLHWICGAIAACASGVFIFKSPFPRYLRLTFPFTYFLVFQYAVVARSYVLVPLMLFCVAHWWRRSMWKVVLFLGLIANLTLHAAVISGGLSLVFLIDQVQSGQATERTQRRRLLLGGAVLFIFYCMALWTAWPPHDLPIASFRGESRNILGLALVAMIWGLCQSWILTSCVWIAIALCLYSRHRVFYLLPVAFFVLFCGVVHFKWWHIGMLTPLILCLLWISWPAPRTGRGRYEFLGRIALAAMAASQIVWSVYAIRFDHGNDYSPDRATADFLRPYVEGGTTIALTYLDAPPDDNAFMAVGILPYFDHNIFANQRDAFWWWSTKNDTEKGFLALLPTHPPVVVVELRPTRVDWTLDSEDPKLKLLSTSGYRLTNVFCGTIPIRTEHGLTNCHLIFRHEPEPSLNPDGGSHQQEPHVAVATGNLLPRESGASRDLRASSHGSGFFR